MSNHLAVATKTQSQLAYPTMLVVINSFLSRPRGRGLEGVGSCNSWTSPHTDK